MKKIKLNRSSSPISVLFNRFLAVFCSPRRFLNPGSLAQKPPICCQTHSKTRILPYNPAIFSPTQTAFAPSNQPKTCISPIWQSFCQLAKSPQEPFL